MRYVVTGGRGFVGSHLVKTLQERAFNDKIYPCDYSSIQEDLNWKPSKDLEDFLPEIIEWYRENIKTFEPFI